MSSNNIKRLDKYELLVEVNGWPGGLLLLFMAAFFDTGAIVLFEECTKSFSSWRGYFFLVVYAINALIALGSTLGAIYCLFSRTIFYFSNSEIYREEFWCGIRVKHKDFSRRDFKAVKICCIKMSRLQYTVLIETKIKKENDIPLLGGTTDAAEIEALLAELTPLLKLPVITEVKKISEEFSLPETMSGFNLDKITKLLNKQDKVNGLADDNGLTKECLFRAEESSFYDKYEFEAEDLGLIEPLSRLKWKEQTDIAQALMEHIFANDKFGMLPQFYGVLTPISKYNFFEKLNTLLIENRAKYLPVFTDFMTVVPVDSTLMSLEYLLVKMQVSDFDIHTNSYFKELLEGDDAVKTLGRLSELCSSYMSLEQFKVNFGQEYDEKTGWFFLCDYAKRAMTESEEADIREFLRNPYVIDSDLPVAGMIQKSLSKYKEAGELNIYITLCRQLTALSGYDEMDIEAEYACRLAGWLVNLELYQDAVNFLDYAAKKNAECDCDWRYLDLAESYLECGHIQTAMNVIQKAEDKYAREFFWCFWLDMCRDKRIEIPEAQIMNFYEQIKKKYDKTPKLSKALIKLACNFNDRDRQMWMKVEKSKRDAYGMHLSYFIGPTYTVGDFLQELGRKPFKSLRMALFTLDRIPKNELSKMINQCFSNDHRMFAVLYSSQFLNTVELRELISAVNYAPPGKFRQWWIKRRNLIKLKSSSKDFLYQMEDKMSRK